MKGAVIVAVIFRFAAVASGQWLNYKTPGIPSLADGKPDLSGVWAAECAVYDGNPCFVRSLFFDLAKDLKPGEVEMTPWAAGVSAQRQSRNHVDDPYGFCLTPGVPRIDFGGGPFKVLQTLVGMIFRQVFTDGRPLPDAPDEPTWLGYSVGRWEGDTFVVESTGFRDGGCIDTQKGRPNSDALRVTERFRRTDFGHMDLAITINDSKAYLKPWTVRTALLLHPDTELLEAFCDDHDKTLTFYANNSNHQSRSAQRN
jgi:hypothetical protein